MAAALSASFKQRSAHALDRARALARSASSRGSRAAPTLLVAPDGGYQPPLDVVFPRERLGVKLVLVQLDGRTAVVVHEVVDGVCPPDVLPSDELVAVDGARVSNLTPRDFDAFVASLKHRARPLTLAFAPGANREAAAAAQRTRINKTRTSSALKTYESRERDGKAAFNAALLRANGVGGAEDRAAALLLLRKSAALGVVRAQVALARLYLQGSGGVKRDDDEAFRWFAAAAETRDADALYELGKCHRRGVGARVDADSARWCFDAAAEQGHEKARAARAALDLDRERRARVHAMVASVKNAVAPPARSDALYETLRREAASSPFVLGVEDPDDYVPPAPRYEPPRVDAPTPTGVFQGRKTAAEETEDGVLV